MTRLSTLARLGALSLLLLASASVGAAAAAQPGPKDRIDAVYGHIKAMADTATTQAELTDLVTAELDTFINYEAFSARTLKTSWGSLSPEQKATFMDRFKRLVIRTYAKKFQPKTEFTVEYRGEPDFMNPDKTDATVKTTVRGKKAAADVDYLVALADNGGKKTWRAYDIVVDEVSMALNWRQQFEKIIAKEGFDSLITKINKKLDKPQEEKSED